MLKIPKNKVPGPGPSGSLYGLYCNHHDRIVITYYDLATISLLSKCISSKIHLEILDIGSCPEWRPNLIDNQVCLDWGIRHCPERYNLASVFLNQEYIVPTKFVNHDDHCHTLQRVNDLAAGILWVLQTIEPTKESVRKSIRARLNKQSLCTLEFFNDSFVKHVKSSIQQGFENQEQQINDFEKNILEILYWCRDLHHLEISLNEFSQQDTVMARIYRSILFQQAA
jgi:hypothetical protein